MSRIVNISEAASIAIHSMVLIAGSNVQLNATQISGQFNFSKNHSAKVLQVLVKSGYLLSMRGPNGGFRINVDPDKTNLLQIYQLMEGRISGKMCNMCIDDCIFEPCIYGDLGERVRKEVKEFLENTTIQELKTKLKLKKD